MARQARLGVSLFAGLLGCVCGTVCGDGPQQVGSGTVACLPLAWHPSCAPLGATGSPGAGNAVGFCDLALSIQNDDISAACFAQNRTCLSHRLSLRREGDSRSSVTLSQDVPAPFGVLLHETRVGHLDPPSPDWEHHYDVRRGRASHGLGEAAATQRMGRGIEKQLLGAGRHRFTCGPHRAWLPGTPKRQLGGLGSR